MAAVVRACRSPSMAASATFIFFVINVIFSTSSLSAANVLPPSQSWSLLKLQQLLNSPPALRSWSANTTDFCSSAGAGDSPVVSCYAGSVTQLRISGPAVLPATFSLDALFTTLARLPYLKVLSLTSLALPGALPGKVGRLTSLEILNLTSNRLTGAIPAGMSRLANLQTLILDNNQLTGVIPPWLTALPSITVLSMHGNSLSGQIPTTITAASSLRLLSLSSNNLSGNVPNLTGLTNLQVLDLTNNSLGPRFPLPERKVAAILLAGNKFTGGLPAELASFNLLQHLDVSNNKFVGPFKPALLALPSLRYLNIAGNRFTGMLSANTSCGDNVEFVDLSSNLLTGSLPECLSVAGGASKEVRYAANCLSGAGGAQREAPVCETQALAVGIPPEEAPKGAVRNVGHVAGVVAAAVAVGLALGALGFAVAIRVKTRRAAEEKPARRVIEHASAAAAAAAGAYPSELLLNARYISQTVKLGALGIPSYRSFSLVELEAATNNFEPASLMSDDSLGQMYRGRLSSGSTVTIRCLKIAKGHTSQSFSRQIELISKFRHRHLVSALGHCFEYNLDDSTVTRLFLVFEHVPNGSLRFHISEGAAEERRLTWLQRISAAIGIAKGIQFLHGWMTPGLFAANLNIANVLLDQNLVAKISSYNLPILTDNIKPEVGAAKSNILADRLNNGDKVDIYNFGVILLEIISGRPMKSPSEVQIFKDQLQLAVTSEGAGRRRAFADPAVSRLCSDESLRTVTEICSRCLSEEAAQRPSVEDVLWNLHFAAQVQDDWRGDSHSSDESPLSPYRSMPRSPKMMIKN